MRFAGAIVADDQQPFVIHWLLELKLRNDKVDQLLGHLIGDDVGPSWRAAVASSASLNWTTDSIGSNWIKSPYFIASAPTLFVIRLHATASLLTNKKSSKGYLLYSAWSGVASVSYTHLRAHETVLDLVCSLLLEKKKHNRFTTYLFLRVQSPAPLNFVNTLAY